MIAFPSSMFWHWKNVPGSAFPNTYWRYPKSNHVIAFPWLPYQFPTILLLEFILHIIISWANPVSFLQVHSGLRIRISPWFLFIPRYRLRIFFSIVCRNKQYFLSYIVYSLSFLNFHWHQISITFLYRMCIDDTHLTDPPFCPPTSWYRLAACNCIRRGSALRQTGLYTVGLMGNANNGYQCFNEWECKC